jgi:hypothetical protein
MIYGTFTFAGQELKLDEYELIQLLRICRVRNKNLYKKFFKFYHEVVSEESKMLFKELFDIDDDET